jgi:hypothetical protein
MLNWMYTGAKQVVAIFWGTGVLQYAFFLVARFAILMTPVLLDSAITIFESIGDMGEELVTGIAEAFSSPSTSRRVFGVETVAGDAGIIAGDILLHVLVTITMFACKLTTAVFVAFAPLLSGFLLQILPKLLRYVPAVVRLVVDLGIVLTSVPFLRIIEALVDLLPIVVELAEAVACALITTLGAATCYLVFGFCVIIGFVLRYLVRPITCGGLTFLSGCIRSFLRSAGDSDSCFSCGSYNTACGCRYGVHAVDGSCSACSDQGDVTDMGADPDPIRGNRSQTAAKRESDVSAGFATDVAGKNTMYEDRQVEDTQLQSQGEGAGIVRYGVAYEECDKGTDSSCGTGGTSTTTKYTLVAPVGDASRRRTSNARPLPVGGMPGGTPPPTPPGPTYAPLSVQGTVSSTTYTPGWTRVVSSEAVPTASVGMYAPMVLMLKDGAQPYVMLGTLPYDDNTGSNATSRCLRGANATDLSSGRFLSYQTSDCGTVISLVGALADSVYETPASGKLGAGSWKGAEWGRDAWYRLDLPRAYEVNQARLAWGVVDTAVRGPGAIAVELHSPDGFITHQSATEMACTTTMWQRSDVIDLVPTVVSAVVFRFAADTTCAYGTHEYAWPDHSTPLDLLLVSLWGVYGSGGDHVDLVNWRHNASVYARATVSNHTTGVQMWDACGTGEPVSMHDGLQWPPSVFFAEPHAGPRELVLNVSPHRVLSTGGSVPVHVDVQRVVVHLAATASIPWRAMRLCSISNRSSCVFPDAASSTDTVSGYTNTTREELNARWNADSGEIKLNASFWDQSRSPPPARSRGASVAFNLDFDARDGMELVFDGDWLGRLPVSTWKIAELELGLDTASYIEAQWMLAVRTAVASSDEGLAATVVPVAPYCPHSKYAPRGGGISALVAPFGELSSSHRPWFGISEVDLFGNFPPANSDTVTMLSQRRLLQVHDPVVSESVRRDTTDEAMERDLAGRSALHTDTDNDVHGTVLSSPYHTMQSLMAERGLSQFEGTALPSALHATASDEAVYDAQTQAASSLGDGQPFSDNLALMPDPRSEVIFTCTPYALGDSPRRMKCWVDTPALLAGRNTTQIDPEWTPRGEAPRTDDLDKHSWLATTARWSSQVAVDTEVLQTRLSSMQTVTEQRTLLRSIRLSMAVNEAATTRPTSQQDPVDAAPLAAAGRPVRRDLAGRRLLGSGIWDTIKGPVMSMINSMLESFEKGIAAAIQCGSYCKTKNGCDSSSLSDCLEGLVNHLAKQIFSCAADESVYDCTIGRVLDWVMSKLTLLLEMIMGYIEAFGGMIGSMFASGNHMKILACQGCAITTAVTGVLSDFSDNFPLTLCLQIVSKGTDQCDKWNMGDPLEIGASIFAQFMPTLQVVFGLIQILPGLVDVFMQVVTVLLGGAMQVFPQMLTDAVDILMFLGTSSLAVDAIETLFESITPIMQEVQDRNQRVRGTSGTASFSDLTGDSIATNNTEVSPAVFPGPPEDPRCYDADDTPPDGCEATIGSEVSGDPFSTTGSTSIQNLTADLETGKLAAQATTKAAKSSSSADISLELTLRCGCRSVAPSCAEGVGTGSCPKKYGSVAVRNQQKRAAAIEAAATAGDDKSEWEECANVPKANLHVDLTGSGEMQKFFHPKRKCYTMVRVQSDGSQLSYMALEDAVFNNNQSATGEPSWWKFQQYVSPVAPDISQVHRRRASSGSQRRLLTSDVHAAHLFGLGTLLYPDMNATVRAQTLREVDDLLEARNHTYAEERVSGISRELVFMRSELRRVVSNITDEMPEMSGVESALRVAGGGVRRLLGFGDGDVDDLVCGFSETVGTAPNSYPCCKHIDWCCFKPLIPDGWYFQREWLMWQDAWIDNTKCPELYTHFDGYLFALRGVFKMARGAAKMFVNVWPYDTLVDLIWGMFRFPDDVWPQSKLHSSPSDIAFTFMCVGLNLGIYVAVLMMVVVAILAGPVILEWVGAHGTLFSDIFGGSTLQVVEVNRRKVARMRIQKRQREGLASSSSTPEVPPSLVGETKGPVLPRFPQKPRRRSGEPAAPPESPQVAPSRANPSVPFKLPTKPPPRYRPRVPPPAPGQDSRSAFPIVASSSEWRLLKK